MGRILITGAGHSGTNLVLEILRYNKDYNIFPNDGIHTEDREIETRILPENYLTKLCTENTMITKKFLGELLTRYADMEVIFCIRHPVDVCMARIYKFKGKQGYDATGNIKHLEHTANIFDFLYDNFRDRLIVAPMPFLLDNFKGYSLALARVCHIDWVSGMEFAYKNIRIKEKQKKYKGCLDKKQINLRTNIKEIFGDFWETKPFNNMKTVIDFYYDKELSIWKNRPTYVYWSGLTEI